MAVYLYDSPIGTIRLVAEAGFITGLYFGHDTRPWTYSDVLPRKVSACGDNVLPHGGSVRDNTPPMACNEAPLHVEEPAELAGSSDADVVLLCVQELDAYFAGQLREFTVPIKAEGTEFRVQVWQALLDIPYGQTMSYKQLAENIGNPKAVRAVGGANHHNPISIIIPCHRVIGAGGGLTGYGGGLENKEVLLALEKKYG